MEENESIKTLEHKIQSLAEKCNMKSDGNGGWIQKIEANQNTDIELLKNDLKHKDRNNEIFKKVIMSSIGLMVIGVLSIGRWVGSIDTTVRLNEDARLTSDIHQQKEISKNSEFVAEWPRTGELPSDVNQNTKIKHLEEQIDEERKYRDILYGKFEGLDTELKKILYSKK